MAHFHFLIDVSISNREFQHTPVYKRLMDQLDHLIELNQNQSKADSIGCTFFSLDIMQTLSPISIEDFKTLLKEDMDFHLGSSILDALGKTVSLIDESIMKTDLPKHLLLFSDFEENSSTYYSVDMISELISDFRQNRAWEFFAFGLKRSQESLFLKMNFNLENLIFLEE